MEGTGAGGRSGRTTPGWTGTDAFTTHNLDYPHALYVRKAGRELPTLVTPSRQRSAGDVNPFGATQSDWVATLHAPRVDGRQRRGVWPEYTPDTSASVGRRWCGATLSDYREGARPWDSSLGPSPDSHRRPTALPRLKDLQESVFPRQLGESPGRRGAGLHSASVLPRGHGGYWAS